MSRLKTMLGLEIRPGQGASPSLSKRCARVVPNVPEIPPRPAPITFRRTFDPLIRAGRHVWPGVCRSFKSTLTHVARSRFGTDIIIAVLRLKGPADLDPGTP